MLSSLLILPEGKTAVERSCLGQWQKCWGSSHLVLKGQERPWTPQSSQAHQAGRSRQVTQVRSETRGVKTTDRFGSAQGGWKGGRPGEPPQMDLRAAKIQNRDVRCMQRAATDGVSLKVSAGNSVSPRGRRLATADFTVGTELLGAQAVLLRGCVWRIRCMHVSSPQPGPCLQLSAERGMVPRAR